MHETSIMKSLVAQINQLAIEYRFKNVTTVKVKLGALSHFSKEHFQEHFNQAVAGTIAERAQLVIEMGLDEMSADAQSVVLEEIEAERAI